MATRCNKQMEKFGNSSAGTMNSAVATVHSGARSDPQDLRHSNFWKGKKNTCTACSSTHSNYQKKVFKDQNTWALPSIHSRGKWIWKIAWRYLKLLFLEQKTYLNIFDITTPKKEIITICYLQHLRNPISESSATRSELSREVCYSAREKAALMI